MQACIICHDVICYGWLPNMAIEFIRPTHFRLEVIDARNGHEPRPSVIHDSPWAKLLPWLQIGIAASFNQSSIDPIRSANQRLCCEKLEKLQAKRLPCSSHQSQTCPDCAIWKLYNKTIIQRWKLQNQVLKSQVWSVVRSAQIQSIRLNLLCLPPTINWTSRMM